jgi:hypothetical protein
MNFPRIENPSACSSRRKEALINCAINVLRRSLSRATALVAPHTEGVQSRQPQRGCLFIDGRALNTPSFCFSAAHKQHGWIEGHIAATLPGHSNSRLLAPPKNKKNKASGAGLAINRPPRWGGNTKDSQNLLQENLWVKRSSAFCLV